MNNSIKFLFLALSLGVLFSCKKDEPKPLVSEQQDISGEWKLVKRSSLNSTHDFIYGEIKWIFGADSVDVINIADSTTNTELTTGKYKYTFSTDLYHPSLVINGQLYGDGIVYLDSMLLDMSFYSQSNIKYKLER